jgi:nucleotide-binding universal stress UspA family protein
MFMKILVCYNNKPRGVAAIKLAQAHAVKWGAEIAVVWAISRDKPLKQKQIQDIEEELEDHLAQLFENCDIAYKMDLLIDTITTGEQIVGFAGQIKADLVVLGLRRRSMTGKVLFGSNAQHILMKAPCPVLSVRREQLKF